MSVRLYSIVSALWHTDNFPEFSAWSQCEIVRFSESVHWHNYNNFWPKYSVNQNQEQIKKF